MEPKSAEMKSQGLPKVLKRSPTIPHVWQNESPRCQNGAPRPPKVPKRHHKALQSATKSPIGTNNKHNYTQTTNDTSNKTKTHTQTHTNTHKHTTTHNHTQTHTQQTSNPNLPRPGARRRRRRYICMCISAYIYTYIYMYICICIYIYTHILIVITSRPRRPPRTFRILASRI